jgi:hypothetical protein
VGRSPRHCGRAQGPPLRNAFPSNRQHVVWRWPGRSHRIRRSQSNRICGRHRCACQSGPCCLLLRRYSAKPNSHLRNQPARIPGAQYTMERTRAERRHATLTPVASAWKQFRASAVSASRTSIIMGEPSRRHAARASQRCINARAPDSETVATAAQKSGLSACGTMDGLPSASRGFSEHIRSVRGLTTGRYVMVAVQGVVKTFSSSTVKWSCNTLPR